MTELQRTDLFPTPIWEFDIDNVEEFNAEIMNDLDRLRREDEGVRYDSNWKSQANDEEVTLDSWHSSQIVSNDEIFVSFQEKLLEVSAKIFADLNVSPLNPPRISCFWANLNGKHALNTPHIHGHGFISGTYYVRTTNKTGDIVFYDPRIEAHMNQPLYQEGLRPPRSVSVTPQDGRFVLFPSWLLHMVKPNLDDMTRIGISFDVEYGHSVFDAAADSPDRQVADVVRQMLDSLVAQDVGKAMAYFADDARSARGGKAELEKFLASMQQAGQLNGATASFDGVRVDVQGSQGVVTGASLRGAFGALPLAFRLEQRTGSWVIVEQR